ncbi:IS3 family transposase (plasmid) [Lacticaseibacillus paracasei]|uniref:IS3 family transposase n=1 Tax=Lacticaseibacillus paracasei TaxID=1597 RepID=UPI00384C36C8
MEGKRGSECLLKPVSNIDFNPYSRMGCPYDNAPMESFHASLKKECVYPVPVFEDYETAAAVLFEYVHAFYNRKRIHSSLGYQTPLQVEIATLKSQMAA